MVAEGPDKRGDAVGCRGRCCGLDRGTTGGLCPGQIPSHKNAPGRRGSLVSRSKTYHSCPGTRDVRHCVGTGITIITSAHITSGHDSSHYKGWLHIELVKKNQQVKKWLWIKVPASIYTAVRQTICAASIPDHLQIHTWTHVHVYNHISSHCKISCYASHCLPFTEELSTVR